MYLSPSEAPPGGVAKSLSITDSCQSNKEPPPPPIVCHTGVGSVVYISNAPRSVLYPNAPLTALVGRVAVVHIADTR